MQLLQSLHNARQVMVVRDLVYVNPADVVNAVHVRLNLPYITNHVSALSEDSATPCDGLQVSAVAPREQDARRRLFWATASLLSSIQMTVLAYLTFVVYGWDVMEPICYFITTTTTLCSYAFGLRYKRSYSHEAVDSQIAASVAVEEGGKLKEDASGLLDGCGCSAIHDVNKPSFVEAVKILRGVQAECADEDFPPSTTGAAARDGGGGLYRSL
uniref:Uncharacterized protein TCIL3000_10_160 n=1 Tax=Trypanosoma congolense (strain IL3000) TaxID=1068625 RepID=G0UV43_TRYCI|nr:unnamed protein product [Trypanosoma congolense IL3000]